METEYVKKRDQLKRANLFEYIFMPTWFIGFVAFDLLSQKYSESNPGLSLTFKGLCILVIVFVIPMLIYGLRQRRPYYGPWAKCEACGADAIVWKPLGDKLTDLTQKFFDECPKCGNDNTSKLTQTQVS